MFGGSWTPSSKKRAQRSHRPRIVEKSYKEDYLDKRRGSNVIPFDELSWRDLRSVKSDTMYKADLFLIYGEDSIHIVKNRKGHRGIVDTEEQLIDYIGKDYFNELKKYNNTLKRTKNKIHTINICV